MRRPDAWQKASLAGLGTVILAWIGMSGTPANERDPGTEFFVHVAGEVKKPGLVGVRFGELVNDAVTRAGGALPGADLNKVNLAEAVRPGMKISVGKKSLISVDQPTTRNAATLVQRAPPKFPISINQATAEQLEALPGVGPVLAKRIVTKRRELGGFKSLNQLILVEGIGPKTRDTISKKAKL